MIAYIKGELTHILEDSVIVDVCGIGYEIECANPFVFQSKLHHEVLIFTYHHVREDAQILYGFQTKEEKTLFENLISVSGIGPKSALAIQGSVNVNDFVAAIEREDEKYLKSFPGIGKKTAQQIILDLRGKLTTLLSTSDKFIKIGQDYDQMNERLQETKEALKALGYVNQEIQKIMPQLRKASEKNTDDLVKEALSLLMKN